MLRLGENLRYGIEKVQDKVELSKKTKDIEESYIIYTESIEEALLNGLKISEEQGAVVKNISHSTKYKSIEARFVAIMKYLDIYGEYRFFNNPKNFCLSVIKCETCNKLSYMCSDCYNKAKASGGKNRTQGDK